MLSQEFMASVGKKLVAEYIQLGNKTYCIFWDNAKRKWDYLRIGSR